MERQTPRDSHQSPGVGCARGCCRVPWVTLGWAAKEQVKEQVGHAARARSPRKRGWRRVSVSVDTTRVSGRCITEFRHRILS